MIAKQQKFIEDNDIGAETGTGDKSNIFLINDFIDLDMFLEGAELDGDDQEN